MLNIIVYEDDNEYLQKNVNCIYKVFANNDIDYRVNKFRTYTAELAKIIKEKGTRKIYVLDIEVNGVTGLEVASRIRENDNESMIIFVTCCEKYKSDVFYNRLMALDFVFKYQGYEERLADTIKYAIDIVDRNRTFVFTYKHTIYRIPYNQICYIEKEPIIKRCIIYTYTNKYCIIGTLNGLMEKLEGNFIRTHQSCIVNASNIKSVDYRTNIIDFGRGITTDMLTNGHKKELKEHVGLN